MKTQWLEPQAQVRGVKNEGKWAGHELLSGTVSRKRRLVAIRHPKGERTCDLAALLQRFEELHGTPCNDVERVAVTPAPRGLYALGDFEVVEYIRPDGRRYRHEFGEEGGALPLLCADLNGKLHVVGGDYTLTEHGIED